MSVTVEITGLDKLAAMAEPARFDQACTRILSRGSQAWADTTKKMPAVSGPRTGYAAKGIPVDSGLMRQEIRPLPVRSLAAGVIAPTKYAGYVLEGTSRMPPRDFFQFALEDFGAMRQLGTIAEEELSQAMNAQR